MLSLAVYGSIGAAERRFASAVERQAVERLALDTADTCPWNGTCKGYWRRLPLMRQVMRCI